MEGVKEYGLLVGKDKSFNPVTPSYLTVALPEDLALLHSFPICQRMPPGTAE